MPDFDEDEENSIHEKRQVDPDKIESEILANERAFLAWVRTNIAITSLGFVMPRFSVWIGEILSRMNPQIPAHRLGIFAPLGEYMIDLVRCSRSSLLGGITSVIGRSSAAKSRPLHGWWPPSQSPS
jgi:hypothetical protein